LYYERGYSQATICRMTGLSASALRVRLFRARGALAAVGG
ncbi:MAG: sigma factor-like helix-turn-helix DNA-binding protein, partial [Planctomycetota bacterium]